MRITLQKWKKALLLSVDFSLLLVFSIATLSTVSAQPTLPVHNVSSGIDYATIQEAVDAEETLDGHTILVDSGVYHENVIIKKAVTLLGESQNAAVVNGNGTGRVVALTASGAKIVGFTVQNGEWGIEISAVQNASVIENRVSNCSYGGIFVHESSTCEVANNTVISTTQAGIYLWESYGILITNNTISNTLHGIYLLVRSTNNTIVENFVTNNTQGIALSYDCDRNTVAGNIVTFSGSGIVMGGSKNNTIYHNNVFHNNRQAWSYGDASNFWDGGNEGNYWGDYAGIDLNLDGVGDTPYAIDEMNRDNYPLTGKFYRFNVTFQQEVFSIDIISNSTVSDLYFKVMDGPEIVKAIGFNVTAEDSSICFCRIIIPTALVNYSYSVLVNGERVDVNVLDISNSTHAYLHFKYSTSTKHVLIVPELPSTLISSLLIILITVITMTAHIRSRKTTPRVSRSATHISTTFILSSTCIGGRAET